MKISENELKKMTLFGKALGRVFTYNDLLIMFPEKSPATFYKTLQNLEYLGIIRRFSRGFYVAKAFELPILSQKICNESYVSFEWVLAKHGMIGTISPTLLRAVKLGPSRIYKMKEFQVEQVSIQKNLFFGFQKIKGVAFANKEKAFLDIMYYYTKGMKFSFDVYSDINFKVLKKTIVFKYLKKYKNPKFVDFVKSYMGGK